MEPFTARNLIITVSKTVLGEFYFRVRDDQDRILLTSANYANVHDCMVDIFCMQAAADCELIVEQLRLTDSHVFFLVSDDGRCIAESRTYRFYSVMNKDMQLLSNNISKAVVCDMSSLVRYFRPVRMQK